MANYKNDVTPTLSSTPIRSFYDGQGREIRRRTRGFDGTFVHTDTEYDSRGREKRSSQPYYEGAPIHWTTPSYDDVNRIAGVMAADRTEDTRKNNRGRTTVYLWI